jgi:hypothetical protein
MVLSVTKGNGRAPRLERKVADAESDVDLVVEVDLF